MPRIISASHAVIVHPDALSSRTPLSGCSTASTSSAATACAASDASGTWTVTSLQTHNIRFRTHVTKKGSLRIMRPRLAVSHVVRSKDETKSSATILRLAAKKSVPAHRNQFENQNMNTHSTRWPCTLTKTAHAGSRPPACQTTAPDQKRTKIAAW